MIQSSGVGGIGRRGSVLMVGLLLNVLLAIAAAVAILDYFGVKPKSEARWSTMRLSNKWKLAIMLLLLVSALGTSGYSFYRSRHPKIIERVVENKVSVPVPCQTNLQSQAKPRARFPKEQTKRDTVKTGSITQGSGSIAQIGGSGNQATINNLAPTPRMLTEGQIAELSNLAGTLPASETIGLFSDNTAEAVKYATAIQNALGVNPINNSIAMVPISIAMSRVDVVVCILDKSHPSFAYASQIATILNENDRGNVGFDPCSQRQLNGKQIMIYVLAQH